MKKSEPDPLDTPPPPSNWRVFSVILGFLLLFIAFALFVTSCSLSVDENGKPVIGVNVEDAARAIIIYTK